MLLGNFIHPNYLVGKYIHPIFASVIKNNRDSDIKSEHVCLGHKATNFFDIFTYMEKIKVAHGLIKLIAAKFFVSTKYVGQCLDGKRKTELAHEIREYALECLGGKTAKTSL